MLRAQLPRTNSLFFAAIAGGLLIALLPIEYSLTAIFGAALLALSIWEPAIGVGAAIVLGPTRAYLAATGRGGLLYDFGQIFFALALAGWLVRGALKREVVIPRLVVLWPLSVWIAAGALSLFNAAEWRDGLNELIKWVEVAFVLIIVYGESKRGRLPWIIGAILLSGAVQAAVGVWQWRFRGVGPESFEVADGLFRAYGSFEQPNPFGGFLGLIWPVAAGLGLAYLPKVFRNTSYLLLATCYLLLATLMLAAIYASASRGAWLGVGAAITALAMFAPRRGWLGVGLVIGVLAAAGALAATGLLPASLTARLANVTDFVNVTDVRGININDANFALVERLAHWQAAQNMIEANPWWGVGLGNYAGAYDAYRLINWPNALGHAHNIYLHTWAETGLVGLAAYVAVWGCVIILTLRTLRSKDARRRGVALGLLGVWAHLLAHHSVDNLHVNNTDLVLGAWFGVLHAIIAAGDSSVDSYPDPGAQPAQRA
jgi:O-antigen ligase